MILPHMGIATATRCSCGAPVHLTDGPGYESMKWQALCYDCYDGAEDSGARAHVRGFGATVDEALWDWQDKHDEAHEVEWSLADLFGDLARQVSEERERQSDWTLRCRGTGGRAEFCPRERICELLYSPPEA